MRTSRRTTDDLVPACVDDTELSAADEAPDDTTAVTGILTIFGSDFEPVTTRAWRVFPPVLAIFKRRRLLVESTHKKANRATLTPKIGVLNQVQALKPTKGSRGAQKDYQNSKHDRYTRLKVFSKTNKNVTRVSDVFVMIDFWLAKY